MYSGCFDTNVISADMPGKGIFHIKVSANGTFRESLLTKYEILKSEDQPELYQVMEGEQVAQIISDKYTLHVEGDKKLLTFSGSKRELEMSISLQGEGFALEIPMSEKERLFGLGDENRQSIMKRGRIATLWKKNISCYGPIPFLVSTDGWAILVNCTYRHSYDLGKTQSDRIQITAAKGPIDFYLILADTMKEAISRYTEVAGKPIVLPKSAYGLTFVNNEEDNARNLLENCAAFRKEEIPCDIMSLEPNWMETLYDFSTRKKWNSKQFYIPYWKPENYNGEWSFFWNLREMGYKLSLWLCCDYDLLWQEEKYVEQKKKEEEGMSGAGIVDNHLAGVIRMDTLTDPNEPWFEHLKKFVDQGAECFKLDGSRQTMEHPDRLWAGKYTDDEIHNMYPVVYAKQMQQGYTNYTGRRAFIFTVNLYAGSQQYAACWAGDTKGDIQNIPYLANLAFCAVPSATCDVDTHEPMGIHFGFLMPWTKIQAWRRWHHPWLMGKRLESMIREYSRLRSALFPYLYSMAHQAARTGLAIARPLSLVYEEDSRYDDLKNVFMLGDSLLVGAFDMHLTLPEGKWLDWFTGDVYEGDREIDYEIPEGKGGALFVREGSVFMTQPPKDFLEDKDTDIYTVNIFPGRDCSFDFIEDDGITYDYRQGGYGCTRLSVTDRGETGFVLEVGLREVQWEKELKLADITDLEVKIFGRKKPALVAVCGQEKEFSYDEEKQITTFVVEKTLRSGEAVLCDITFKGEEKVLCQNNLR